jgi:hypothetical protein
MTLEEEASLEIQAAFAELDRLTDFDNPIMSGDITKTMIAERYKITRSGAEGFMHHVADTQPGWKCLKAYDPSEHRTILVLRKAQLVAVPFV